MLKQLRTTIVLFTLGASPAIGVAPAPARAQQTAQSSLELRKWKYQLDEKGQTWLVFRFMNMGGHAIIVNAITVNSHGAWATVAQRVEPDATLNWKMRVKNKPASVWLDTNRGVARFDLLAD